MSLNTSKRVTISFLGQLSIVDTIDVVPVLSDVGDLGSVLSSGLSFNSRYDAT